MYTAACYQADRQLFRRWVSFHLLPSLPLQAPCPLQGKQMVLTRIVATQQGVIVARPPPSYSDAPVTKLRPYDI
jgi:hypothetical protein